MPGDLRTQFVTYSLQTIVLSLEDGGQNHSVSEEGEENYCLSCWIWVAVCDFYMLVLNQGFDEFDELSPKHVSMI